MIDTDLINQKFLAQEIESLERGYVETAINLIKWPIFIEACEKDLEQSEWERKEAIEKTLSVHKANQKANEEAILQLNRIIVEAKKLIK